MKEKKQAKMYEVEIKWEMKGKVYIEAESSEALDKILKEDLQELNLPEVLEEVENSISIIKIK